MIQLCFQHIDKPQIGKTTEFLNTTHGRNLFCLELRGIKHRKKWKTFDYLQRRLLLVQKMQHVVFFVHGTIMDRKLIVKFFSLENQDLCVRIYKRVLWKRSAHVDTVQANSFELDQNSREGSRNVESKMTCEDTQTQIEVNWTNRAGRKGNNNILKRYVSSQSRHIFRCNAYARCNQNSGSVHLECF